MEFNSFELFEIKCLIEMKIKGLKLAVDLEKDIKFKTELEKYVDDYIKIYDKLDILYQKTLLNEISL